MHARLHPGQSRGGRNAPGRGQFNGTATRTNTAQTPEKIKCKICTKVKGWQAFSETQRKKVLAKLAKDPLFDPRVTAVADCLEERRTKFEDMCNACDDVKGKNEFNQVQWKKTYLEEGGTCKDCQEKDKYEPDAHESDEDRTQSPPSYSDGEEDEKFYQFP